MTFWNWFTLFWCATGTGSAMMAVYFRGRVDTINDRIAELDWQINGCRGSRPVEGKISWSSLSISFGLSLFLIAMLVISLRGGK